MCRLPTHAIQATREDSAAVIPELELGKEIDVSSEGALIGNLTTRPSA